jgi:flagellar basal-body rod protein FlgB
MDNHPVNLFGGSVSTLSRSLDLRARNHELILNNVANADTPNFKPFSINVEEALQKDAPTAVSTPLTQTDDSTCQVHRCPMIQRPRCGAVSR